MKDNLLHLCFVIDESGARCAASTLDISNAMRKLSSELSNDTAKYAADNNLSLQ